MRTMHYAKPGAESGAPRGPDDPVTSGSRVGAELRAARERLGWELPAVAASLRIRLPYLEALEDGRLGELPGNAYAVMFLRSYADLLGLDSDEAVRRFRAEANGVNRKTELAFPAPVPERGVPAGALALLGIVLAVVAYAGWYRVSGDRQTLAEAVPPVPARLAPLAQSVTPSIAPSPQVASVLPAPAPGDPVIRPMRSVPPSQAAAAVPALPAIPTPAAEPAPGAAGNTAPGTGADPVSGQEASGAPGSMPAAGSGQIVLRASGNSWMLVRARGGGVLLNKVMHAGDSWTVPADQAQLLLTTGNAGATQVLVDGVLSPSLGNSGAVRRNLPLDAEAIRDGKLAQTVSVPSVSATIGSPAAPSAASGASGSTPRTPAQ